MAPCYYAMLSVTLVILTATRVCSGEDPGSQDQTAVISAIQDVSQVLKEGFLNIYNKLQNIDKRLEESQQQLDGKLLSKHPIETKETGDNAGSKTRECQQHPQLETIKKLVQKYIKNETDWTTMWTDVTDMVDHNEYTQLEGSSSPDAAGWHNCIQLISLLLCAGLPVNTADSDGYTMLHGAARGGHMLLVKLLVESGANVNAAGIYGHTPLIYAAFSGNLELVQCLVQAGADTAAKNKYGNNALDEARRWKQTAVEQYLLKLPH